MIKFNEFLEIANELSLLFEADWFDRLQKEISRKQTNKKYILKIEDEKFANDFLNNLDLSIDNYKKQLIINQILKYIESLRNYNNENSKEEASDIIKFLSSDLIKIKPKNLIDLQKTANYHLKKTSI